MKSEKRSEIKNTTVLVDDVRDKGILVWDGMGTLVDCLRGSLIDLSLISDRPIFVGLLEPRPVAIDAFLLPDVFNRGTGKRKKRVQQGKKSENSSRAPKK